MNFNTYTSMLSNMYLTFKNCSKAEVTHCSAGFGVSVNLLEALNYAKNFGFGPVGKNIMLPFVSSSLSLSLSFADRVSPD